MKKLLYVLYFLTFFSAFYLSYIFINTQTKFNVLNDDEVNNSFISGLITDVGSGYIITNIGTGSYKIDINKNIYGDINFAIGQKVSLMKYINQDGNVLYSFVNFYFLDGIIFIILIFITSVILISKIKGINAVFSVFLSLLLFYTIFISMVKIGYNPLFAAFVYVFYITVLTIPIIHGFNFKSLSTLISIFIGYFISILISYLFLYITKVAFIPYEEFKNLQVQVPQIDIYNIILAVIFIGLSGALIDTVISVISAVYEYVLQNNSNISFKKIYKIGMSVGSDIIGSMTNTLLLAFLASSIPFFIILSILKSSDIIEIINYDIVAFELTRIFISGVVLVWIIPISAVCVSFILNKYFINKQ